MDLRRRTKGKRLPVLYVLHLVDVWSGCRFHDRRLFLQGAHLSSIPAHAGRSRHRTASSRRHSELSENMKTVIVAACALSLSIFSATANPQDEEFEKIAKEYCENYLASHPETATELGV